MKLTLNTITILLAATIGLARPGLGQQAYPYQMQAQAYQSQAYQAQAAYGPHAGYPGAQVAATQTLGPGSSVMTQPAASGAMAAPPVASPSYPAPHMSAPMAYSPGCSTGGCDTGGYIVGCDDPGCSDSCGSGGLFSGCGLLGGGGGRGAGNLSNRIFGGTEYLLFWHKKRTLPTLATTSPQGTPSALAGVLGQPTTNVLFGNEEISEDVVTGIRSTVGFWLNDARSIGVGVRYFDMDEQDERYFAQSDGDPILARPFFNLDPGVNAEDALLVAYPGISTGNITASSETDIDGYEAFARYNLFCGYGNRIDALVGYQHTEIDDNIILRHNITSVDGFTHGPVGTEIYSQDRYRASNEFDGGQIGFLSEASDGRLTWSLLTKIAFGNMRQGYTIDGFSRTTVPGAGSAAVNNGLLNLPSYNGSYERDEFAIVPELNVSVAFALTQSIQLSVGYNFLYWSDVMLANQVIDTAINPTQVTGGLVGQAAPTFAWPASQSFWTQGLSFGGTIKF